MYCGWKDNVERLLVLQAEVVWMFKCCSMARFALIVQNGKKAGQRPFKIKHVLMKQGGRSEGFHCLRSATRPEEDWA